MWNVRDQAITVVVADDHAAVRESLSLLLGDYGLRIVAQARNGQEAVWECQRLRPDIVVLDISMPLLNGLDAARQITSLCPTTKIIFLSGHENEYAEEALRAGGAAFVSKREAASCLPDAVAAVLDGRTYVNRRPAA